MDELEQQLAVFTAAHPRIVLIAALALVATNTVNAATSKVDLLALEEKSPRLAGLIWIARGAGQVARCPLWIADYRARPAPEVPRPWGQAAIWQHSGDGRCPGVAGAVDRNRWLGDEAALVAWAEGRC